MINFENLLQITNNTLLIGSILIIHSKDLITTIIRGYKIGSNSLYDNRLYLFTSLLSDALILRIVQTFPILKYSFIIIYNLFGFSSEFSYKLHIHRKIMPFVIVSFGDTCNITLAVYIALGLAILAYIIVLKLLKFNLIEIDSLEILYLNMEKYLKEILHFLYIISFFPIIISTSKIVNNFI